MNDVRFLNQAQPQTLVSATLLCYIDAVFGLLDSGGFRQLIFISVALGLGGFGIANEKKWGYIVAIAGAVLQVLFWLGIFGGNILGYPQIITFAFAVILVVLLVHPMSRDYQRLWFR